jgi:hypothetical protein
LFSRCTTSAGVLPTGGRARDQSEARFCQRFMRSLVERLELVLEGLIHLLSADLER